MIHQPFQAQHAYHIRFRFFQRAVRRAESPRGCLCAPSSVLRVRRLPSRAKFHASAWTPGTRSPLTTAACSGQHLHRLGHRQNDVLHARIHEILEKDLLRPFLLMHSRIVRQIVGYRLVDSAAPGRPNGTARPSLPSAIVFRAWMASPPPVAATTLAVPAHTSETFPVSGFAPRCG